MQRKPGFPVANCNIKMPDALPVMESLPPEEEGEQLHRRQQLINFGHAQWGFNNWSWSVSKQELDFVDFSNGKYCAGVVAFVSVTVKNFDIHRENIGYATSIATNKGAAIFKSRKCAVTNALKETLLSFGGNVATELLELLEQHRELPTTVASIATVATPAIPTPAPEQENNQNVLNRPPEVKNSPVNKIRKDDVPSNMRVPVPSIKNAVPPPPPVAKALPMPCAPAPAPRPPAPPAPRGPLRPPSNEPRVPDSMTEEEARAERKRRQQKAQEEFRLKQLQKQKQGNDEKEKACTSSSFDHLLLDIPTQDIVIEQTGEDTGKRKSPAIDTGAKRRAGVSRLDIVTD